MMLVSEYANHNHQTRGEDQKERGQTESNCGENESNRSFHRGASVVRRVIRAEKLFAKPFFRQLSILKTGQCFGLRIDEKGVMGR